MGAAMSGNQLSWMRHAACRRLSCPTWMFFPAPRDLVTRAAALAVCAQCPVAAECLAYALSVEEGGGIWGGTTEKERRRLRGALEAARG